MCVCVCVCVYVCMYVSVCILSGHRHRKYTLTTIICVYLRTSVI